MTRDQALKAVAATFPTAMPLTPEARHAEHVIRALEVLGVIRLDKDERDEGHRFVREMASAWQGSATHGTDNLARAIIEDVTTAGFKIVRADP